MTKSAKLNKILSIAVSIAAVALSAYSPGTALAGTNEVSYNYYKQSTAGEYIDSVFSDETLNDFGIASYGGGFNRDNADGLFDTSSKYQKNTTPNTASTHVVYNIEPETEFSADFAVISASELKSYIQKKDFIMKIQGWDSLNEKWNSITELSFSKDSYDETKKNYSVVITDDKNLYSKIRIMWPGRASSNRNKWLGSGTLGLAGVKFSPPAVDDRVLYDYTDSKRFPVDASLKIGANLDPLASPAILGIYGISANTAIPSICGLDRSGNTNGALRANRDMIVKSEVGTAEFYADYHVAGGSKFTAIVTVDDDSGWGKPVWEALECYAGRKFEFRFLTSPDGVDWTLATSTGEKSGKMSVEFKIPNDAKFVRVLFPQDGNPQGKDVDDGKPVFNDMALLQSVKYEPGENSIYGKYFDFSAIGRQKLDYSDSVYESLLFYKYKGVEISKFSDGRTYLGVTENYARGEAEKIRPYVIYKIKPETDTKLVVTRNVEKCAEMGEKWNLKVYESADEINWNAVAAVPETTEDKRLGTTDTYKFVSAVDTMYLKIEFPHSGVIGNESGVGFIGVMNVGITPGEYEELDVYGSHSFANKIDYTDAETYNDSLDINISSKTKYDIYQGRIDSLTFTKGWGVRILWGYLYGRKSVSKPYASYNVVPGTAFQTEITFDTSSNSVINNAMNDEFLPKLYVSKDHKSWQKGNYESVKTSKSAINSRRGALILTIDKIPDGMNFVKIEFPQTGDVSLITEKAFAWAGNDIMEIATVSYTKGTMTPPEDLDAGDDDPQNNGGGGGSTTPPKYDFEAPTIDETNTTWTPGETYNEPDGTFDFEDTVTEIETVKQPKVRRGKKIVRRAVTVIDGYYYPWWVWTLWIGGGVLAAAGITVFTIIFVKRNKKKKQI